MRTSPVGSLPVMESVESDDRSADAPGRARLVVMACVVGAATLVGVLVVTRLRKGVGGEVADLAEEGVVLLTDAILDGVFASG